MERVGFLINKLQEQLLQQTDVDHLLVTTHLLQAELMQIQHSAANKSTAKVAVIVPNALRLAPHSAAIDNTDSFYKPVEKPEPEPEPVVTPVNEPEVPITAPQPTPKPEPEPIPHFVEEKPWQRLFVEKDEPNTPWHVDPMTEIPTLAHQEKIVFELNDVIVNDSVVSLNDTLKQSKDEVVTTLQDSPVKDLKKAISINDRHQFIQELFRGDETMYERSIKTINSFHIFAEAEYWIQRELKVKLGWDTTLDVVKVFDQVVKRRFA